MSWIKIIDYNSATGTLKRLYDKIKGADNYIDNILLVHSLRPHSLKGHMALYKNVLHHQGNTIPKSFLETLGVYVSYLNKCHYCVDHHFAGLSRLLNDDQRSQKIWYVLTTENLHEYFDKKEIALFEYAKKLTLTPGDLNSEAVQKLKDQGYDDGEILEANQVISYFNYANRTVLGLGVNTDGDILGLSPNDDHTEDNW